MWPASALKLSIMVYGTIVFLRGCQWYDRIRSGEFVEDIEPIESEIEYSLGTIREHELPLWSQNVRITRETDRKVKNTLSELK